GAKNYSVLRNGTIVQNTTSTAIPVKAIGYAEYQVIAMGENGFGSFASEPVPVKSPGVEKIYEIENYVAKSANGYKGFSGDGFVEISKDVNTIINIPITVKEA